MAYFDWSEGIKKVKGVIKEGGVALLEGDTVLGLSAELTQEGFEALNHIKRRYEKPYLVLVSGIDKAMNLVDTDFHKDLLPFLSKIWPGPVTLIFKANVHLQPFLKGPEGTIGIRIPAHSSLLELLEDIPGLFSTSANIAGQPVPRSLEDVNKEIVDLVGCVVINDQRGHVIPSTIIDLSQGGFEVIREGAYPVADLKECYKNCK